MPRKESINCAVSVCGSLLWTSNTIITIAGGLGNPHGLLLPLPSLCAGCVAFPWATDTFVRAPSFEYLSKEQRSCKNSGQSSPVVGTLDTAANPRVRALALTRNKYRNQGKGSEGVPSLRILMLKLGGGRGGMRLSSLNKGQAFYQLLPRIYSVDLDRFSVGKRTISYSMTSYSQRHRQFSPDKISFMELTFWIHLLWKFGWGQQ